MPSGFSHPVEGQGDHNLSSWPPPLGSVSQSPKCQSRSLPGGQGKEGTRERESTALEQMGEGEARNSLPVVICPHVQGKEIHAGLLGGKELGLGSVGEGVF